MPRWRSVSSLHHSSFSSDIRYQLRVSKLTKARWRLFSIGLSPR